MNGSIYLTHFEAIVHLEHSFTEESKKIQKLREKLKRHLAQMEQKVAERSFKNKTVTLRGKEARELLPLLQNKVAK